MRLGVKPGSFAERLALRANLAPEPILETQIALLSARAILAATEAGIFSCLAKGGLKLEAIAAQCDLNQRATGPLLGALVSTHCLTYKDGQYELTPKSRKWLAAQETWSLFDYMPHVGDVWQIAERLDQFLRDGRALDIHDGGFSAGHWHRYQRAMRALAAIAAPEVAARLPLRKNAKRMLDIGGSHGFYAVALCRKHPQLTATILDLPEAIEHAAPILAREQMGDRVQHLAGNALTDNFGERSYDLILISNLVHHFTAEQNRDLIPRAARALTPGGSLVIQEPVRPATPNSGDQVGQTLNLFFALTSTSGTWSIPEIQSWLGEAKLRLRRPTFLRSIPGTAQIVGQA